MATKPVLLGFMGNRGFFPSEFADDGAKATRSRVESILGDRFEYVELGKIETYADAKAAAAKAQQYKLDPDNHGAVGIICGMYNFSEETGIRDFCRLADLDIPILIHTEPDTRNAGKMGQTGRRDGACGRFSATNSLRHIGHPYTLTTYHVEAVESDIFAEDLQAFAATCIIASKFRRRGRGVRVGLVGGPPDAFQTMTQISPELLGHLGLNTVGLELLELDRRMAAVPDDQVAAKIAEVREYLPADNVPDVSLETIARMGVVFDWFIQANELDGLAIRCWTELQKFKIGGKAGIVPCTCMSMLGEKFMPAACETDIGGWLGMYMLQTASDLIPFLADWNNMFDDARDEIDLFHCGVWAKSTLREGACLGEQEIIATDPDVGLENTWGTIQGHLKPGTCAFFRPCTNAREGKVFAYGGVGEVVDETIDTFGTKGRARIPNLQAMLDHVTAFDRAVEHHIPVIVGESRTIKLAMKAVRDAIPYINHQAGRNTFGAELIEYYEHNRLD